jgi:16S rRNA (cytosine967-C5)-methyltransferase
MRRYYFGKDPRAIATFVCFAVNSTEQRAKDLLDHELERTGFSRRDRDLTTELVYGMLRRRGTLDCVIDAVSDLPLRKIQPRVLDVLRCGAYQLLFLDKVPPRAAVNEAVRIAKRVSSKGAAGFVNACLRALSRDIVGKTEEPGDHPRRALPLGDGGYCRLKRSVLPDPSRSLAVYLAAAWSHPEWLVRRWIQRFGEETTRALCAQNNVTLPIVLRVNRMRSTREELTDELVGEEGRWARPQGTDHVMVSHGGSLGDLAPLREGRCTVQGIAASAAAPLLDPQPGERVLDLCAAPGSKACQLAELAENQARVVAVDISPGRLLQVRENVRRLGLSGVQPVAADGTACGRLFRQPFDAALVDVPCSNTGVLARRVESRWRLTEARLQELAELQGRLLAAAAAVVRPGGRLVYSTCSLETEENEAVVEGLCRRTGAWDLAEQRLFLPPETRDDGGYVALLCQKM